MGILNKEKLTTIADKIKKSRKTGQDEKLRNLFLYNFWPLYPIFFLEGKLDTKLCLHQFLSFFQISEFPKILSLVSFGNLYTVLFVVDFMYHFTYGESNHAKTLKCFIILYLRLQNECFPAMCCVFFLFVFFCCCFFHNLIFIVVIVRIKNIVGFYLRTIVL